MLIINMGPHYTRTYTFANWQTHVDVLAAALKVTLADTTGITVVWRTSFMTKVCGAKP